MNIVNASLCMATFSIDSKIARSFVSHGGLLRGSIRPMSVLALVVKMPFCHGRQNEKEYMSSVCAKFSRMLGFQHER